MTVQVRADACRHANARYTGDGRIGCPDCDARWWPRRDAIDRLQAEYLRRLDRRRRRREWWARLRAPSRWFRAGRPNG